MGVGRLRIWFVVCWIIEGEDLCLEDSVDSRRMEVMVMLVVVVSRFLSEWGWGRLRVRLEGGWVE